METQPSGSPAAAAAASCPLWVYTYGDCRDSIVARSKTSVAACTSTGRSFRVALHAEPPASSRLYYSFLGGKSGGDEELDARKTSLEVIAAQGDAAVLKVTAPEKRWERGYGYGADATTDYFLYEAGAGARRPPSLSLLPGCYFTALYDRPSDGDSSTDSARALRSGGVGLLRRGRGGGERELLVAELDLHLRHDEHRYAVEAEVCVLRPGRGEWELKRAAPIIRGREREGDEDDDALQRWETDAAVPVGDRFLCWVDYTGGLLVCDMAVAADDDEASLKLRYMPLPVPPESYYERPCLKSCRNLSGFGAGAVRFVNVEPRCCCGGPGSTSCARGRFFFNVTTWTLNLSTATDGETAMEWVKDGVLDCDELWADPAYRGLPRVTVEYPMVSSDEADMVCFLVRNDYRCHLDRENRRVWAIEADMRRKTLRSVVPCTDGGYPEYRVPAKLQC